MLNRDNTADVGRLPLVPAKRPGWYRVDGYPGRSLYDDPELLAVARALPGVMDGPGGSGQIWVPWNLVEALPELWTVKQPLLPPVLPSAHAVAQGEEGAAFPEARLRPYQRECVALARRAGGGGAYLALDLGVGKTRTAVAAAVADRFERVLITGPVIARGAWVGPLSDPTACFGVQVRALEGRLLAESDGKATLEPGGWFFAHWDILEAWAVPVMWYLRPECIILDELDLVRNARGRRSRSIRAVARLNTVRRRVGLSGTPVHNSLMDLWAQLDTIEPDAWGTRHQFGVRYLDGQPGEYGPVYGEPTNTEELEARLRCVYVRKERQEVLLDLPDITRVRVEATLDSKVMERYDAAYHNIRAYLNDLNAGLAPGARSGDTLVQLTTLLRLISEAKADTSIEVARRALETGAKVVVFAWFKPAAKKIAKALGAGVVVDGDMPVERRLERAADFALNPNARVFVATIAAAGVSLNGLQAASHVVVNDLWWAPAKILQAEGRVWRSGQVDPVTGHYICGAGTIDDKLLEVLVAKAPHMDSTQTDSAPRSLLDTIACADAKPDAISMIEELRAIFATQEALQ